MDKQHRAHATASALRAPSTKTKAPPSISRDAGFVEVASPGGLVEEFLAKDDGLAAKTHLAAGRSIFVADPNFPGGLVKAYPDGRKELVRIANGQVVLLKTL